MLGLGVALSKAATQAASGLRYVRDNLKLYMPFKTSHEVKFVGTGSMLFDGGSNCVTTSAETSKRNTTYCFWAKSTVTGSNYGVFGHGSTSIGSFAMNVSNKPFLSMGDGSNIRRFWDDNPAQDDGNWHHWAVYIDSSAIADSELYVDGILQAEDSINAGTPAAYTEGLTIGASKADGTEGWGGSLAQFGVWSRELTQTEIQNIMYKSYEQLSGTETQGLENYWKLDADYTDSTGNDNGTNSGSTLKSGIYGNYTPKIPRAVDNAPTARADTIGNGSASFTDDNDDYIALASETSISGDWTVSAWVKPTVVNYRAIVASSKEVQTLVGFSGTDDLIVRLEKASGISYWYINFDPGFADWSTTDWFHLAVTKVGTTITPYLNGIVGSTGTLNGSDGVLKVRAIGIMFADDTIQYKFDGNIAQLGIWSAALTQAQIQEVKEKSFGELSASDKTNLVSYWTLDEETGTDGEAGSGGVKDHVGSNHGTLA